MSNSGTPLSKIDDKYDAIIIGAGIGGLVCGCYLAKAGMKVLIVEKNNKPGGYCTSFKRGGFTFDACVHYLGSCREDGLLAGVIRDLGLEKKLELIRINPSDLIITPDYEIAFDNDIAKTIETFQQIFPKESKKIKDFFNTIIKGNFGWRYVFLKKYTTFADLLNDYFDNYKLKWMLGTLMVNLGLSSNEVTSMAAITLYREFILDGGYYPRGGIQTLPNSLAERFKEFGGNLLLNHLVKKIKMENSKVAGIILEDNNAIYSRYVVSNADVIQTFTKMVGKEYLSQEFISKITRKIPSLSMFIIYLGISNNLKEMFKKCGCLWYWPTYANLTREYIDITSNKSADAAISCTVPSLHDNSLSPNLNTSTLRLMSCASFRDENYWQENKLNLSDTLIKRAEKLIPNLSNYIKVKEIATPQTLYKYTLNNRGAVYGWASIPFQSDESVNYKTPVRNLFLAGQWVSFFGIQGGISMVALVGRNVSRSILESYRREDR